MNFDAFNQAPLAEAARALDGLYEHNPWIVEQALAQRPFASPAALKRAMVEVLEAAGREAKLALIRAHPELAGKAMVSQTLTAESTHEQSKAGLTQCTPDEFAHIQQLNADYNARFGWPFILAVRGPRGLGLSKAQIIAAFERRLHDPIDVELDECIRNIHRIAEIRLADKLSLSNPWGEQVWDWCEQLAQHSESTDGLTVTYLSDAHRACAQRISHWMHGCGFDEVEIDAVGNVVGRYYGHNRSAPALLTGSHYDTVRNGGKYDGRLGIFVPMAVVKDLHARGQRPTRTLEVVAFAEEEGQRYAATFLGSGALVGDFNAEWLAQRDAQAISLREAMQSAGLCIDDIPQLERDPAKYVGFVEVHIEQGPVLNHAQMPLGIVTSINGSARFHGQVRGMASHAGTTPMGQRRDAAAAVAEFMLAAEARAAQDGDSVATVGMLNVPNGAINVVPGRCDFSLDVRAPSNAQRDALLTDLQASLQTIAARRGVQAHLQEAMRASAAPSDAALRQAWEQAVTALGLPLYALPSGAGHDAMKLHERMPQAMLFVRGENHGISHNPLESTSSEDMGLAVSAFAHLLQQLR